VRYPAAGYAGGAELLACGGADLAALLAVADPEVADAVVRMGEGEAVCSLRVTEATGVKVHAEAIGRAPVKPALEVLHADLVAVNFFAAKVAVNGVQIEAVLAGDQAQGFF